MNHQDHNHTRHQPEGLPSLFAFDDAVLLDEHPWVVKDQLRGLKADPVFGKIAAILAFIPFKPQWP